MSRTAEILSRLVAFPTVSRTDNTALMDYCATTLAAAGATLTRIPYEDGRDNLYAVIGPEDGAPVVLSGHTDVVPVEGQAWTRPPFELTEANGKLFGRGTTDMKGFVAAALSAAERAGSAPLKRPLALALSCDEEVGCLGVRPMVDALAKAPVRPSLVIVGEPTNLSVATGHKGKTALRAEVYGREGHSALAPFALNALYLASDFVAALRARQAAIAAHGARDADYDVPYTTLHPGKLSGGVALNIVPNRATVDFEIRALAEDDMGAIVDELRAEAANVCAATGDPDAKIAIESVFSYPGLATDDRTAIDFVKGLTGANGTIKVAYGTEGGLFSERVGAPVVVCGPGSMAQGHRPDEFIAKEQLDRCDQMLTALIDRLC
ncbi:MAG: acetylornithine deacetylase [Pseudomonadota bacterium]